MIFSLSEELSKSFVRECFFLQTQMLDGICAALLHLTQSEDVKDYYRNRLKRLRNPSANDYKHIVDSRPRSDKLL